VIETPDLGAADLHALASALVRLLEGHEAKVMYGNLRGNMAGMVLALTLATAPLSAQQGQDLGQRLSDNYRALREYSWTMRTSAAVQGQQVSVTVDKMRYDLDGKLQVTPLGARRRWP